MSHFVKAGRICWRLMILTVLVILSLAPVQSWVSAQNPSARGWVVRTIHTSELGVAQPGGLAFSAPTSTFIVLDANGNSTLLTMDEDNAGTQVLPEAQGNAINAAFDNGKGSLFVLNHGRGEIAEIRSDGNGLPNPSAPPARSAIQAFGIKDPQGITLARKMGVCSFWTQAARRLSL